MPRLPRVDPATATGPAKDLLDGPLKGKHFNIFLSMANSPAALNAYLAMSGTLGKGALTDAEREAIALAIGEANECDYCLAAHSAIGKGAGMGDEAIVGSRRGEVPADPKLDALVRFALRLHEKRGFVDDQDIADFKRAGYTNEHIPEVVAAYALNTFTNYFNHLNQTEVDFPSVPKL